MITSLMGNRWRILLSMLVLALSAMQLKAQDVPAAINYVSDFAGVLSSEEEALLNDKIKSVSDSTATEIAIVIESDLNGKDEFDRSLEFARAYKVGAEGMNTGVLVYVSINDRKIFIQTADKTQGELTDYICKIIIENSIKPEFKAGNYYQGLDNAVESIHQVLKGEFNPEKVKKKGRGGSVLSILFIVILVIIILSIFGKGGNGGFTRGGGYFLPGMLFGGGGFGGGGSSGGGGFGGFGGGGGFNGGGAGGSW